MAKKRRGRTFTPEQRQAYRKAAIERWEQKRDNPPKTGDIMPIDPVTEQARAESSQRLHNLLEQNRVKEGEDHPMPPDLPANYGKLPETGKGGAISQTEREVGVDVIKPVSAAPPAEQPPERPPLPSNHHPLKPDYVRRRGEPKEEAEVSEAPVSIREDLAPLPSDDNSIILRIPDWETVPLDESEAWLQMLRAEATKGADIVNRRMGESGAPVNRCANPACEKVVPDGKEAFSKTVQDPITKLYRRLVVCSARCWSIWSKGPGLPRPAAPGANLSSRDR